MVRLWMEGGTRFVEMSYRPARCCPVYLGNGVESREGPDHHSEKDDQSVRAEDEMVNPLDLPVANPSVEEQRSGVPSVERLCS